MDNLLQTERQAVNDLGIAELRTLADHVDPSQRWGSVSHFIRSGYSVNVAEYLAAASPDVITALCDHLAEAEAILNDLANNGPPVSDYAYQCGLCLMGRPSDGESWVHAESCAWRRAVERKDKQQ